MTDLWGFEDYSFISGYAVVIHKILPFFMWMGQHEVSLQNKSIAKQKTMPWRKIVINNPLVDRIKITLPPLHIKLDLIKNFLKAMDKDGEGFKYLRGKFPQLSDAKVKEGIFVGPQIRKLMKDENYKNLRNINEKAAWEAFKKAVKGIFR